MPEMPRREVQSFSSLVMLMQLPKFWGYGRERCRGVIVSVRRPIRMATTCESANRPTEQQTSSRLAKVLEVPTWCRAALTLVFRAPSAGSVRLVGRSGHRHETHLTDLHARINGDREIRYVRQLERDVTVEAGVDEAGRRMDEKSEPTERALSLDPRDEVAGDGDSLERGAQHEFARVQHERFVTGNFNELGQIGEVLLHVDDRRRVVAKHAEEVRHLHVDRRRLQARLVERVDDDATSCDGFADAAVGENHRPRTLVSLAPRRPERPEAIRRTRWYDFVGSAGVVQWQNISFPS